MSRDPQEIWFIHALSHLRSDGVREPLCVAALDAQTGEIVDGWLESLPNSAPFGGDALVVLCDAPSVFAAFRAAGWRRPGHFIDLFAEFRNATNGQVDKPTLFDALAWYPLPGPSYAQRCLISEICAQDQTYSGEDKARASAFAADCATALVALFDRCLRDAEPRFARLRGEYTWAAAAVEARGIPLDRAAVAMLTTDRQAVKRRLVVALAGIGKVWPTAIINTIRPFNKFAPPLADDDRSRPALLPFGTKTGRNTPRADHIALAPRWLRGMLRAPAGRMLALLDWRCQELAVAAALSGDERMWAVAVDPVDPYVRLGVELKLLPLGATETSHPRMRSIVKTLVLAVLNGAGTARLAAILGDDSDRAAHALNRFEFTFRQFWQWRFYQVDMANLAGKVQTRLGWTLRMPSNAAGAKVRQTTLYNFPVQANAAEMMRIAVILAERSGVELCTPIHDAFLIEADTGEIDRAAALMQRQMDRASAHVLGKGRIIPVKTKIGERGEALLEPRDAQMWRAVFGDALDAQDLSRGGREPVPSQDTRTILFEDQ